MKNNLINPWSHLPNAAHIDRVLGSLKSHPKVWKAAWGATYYAAHDAARDAILALIAYDDAVKYLDMSSNQLKIWAILSEEPAAILLLPAVISYEKIGALELA